VLGFVATLTLAVTAALGASELFVRRHVIPSDPIESARRAFHGTPAKIAAFGDSRIQSGIDPAAGIANFGVPGDSLDAALAKALAWSARQPDARIVLGIPPQQFSQQRLAQDERELVEDFISLEPPPLQIMRRIHRQFLLGYVRAVIEDPGILLRTPQPPSPRTAVDAALVFSDLAPEARRGQAARRIQHHTPVSGFENTNLARTLRGRIEELARNGTQICLVTMPVSGAYRESAEASPDFARMRGFLARVAGALGLPYLDLWSVYPDNLFRDPDHLTPAGARQVTRDIRARCFADRERSTG
jgi:hypothetical protein